MAIQTNSGLRAELSPLKNRSVNSVFVTEPGRTATQPRPKLPLVEPEARPTMTKGVVPAANAFGNVTTASLYDPLDVLPSAATFPHWMLPPKSAMPAYIYAG